MRVLQDRLAIVETEQLTMVNTLSLMQAKIRSLSTMHMPTRQLYTESSGSGSAPGSIAMPVPMPPASAPPAQGDLMALVDLSGPAPAVATATQSVSTDDGPFLH